MIVSSDDASEGMTMGMGRVKNIGKIRTISDSHPVKENVILPGTVLMCYAMIWTRFTFCNN